MPLPPQGHFFMLKVYINSNEEESLYKGESRLQPHTKEKELWLL